MEVVCPSCLKSLEAPDDIIDGTHLKCPICGMRFAFSGDSACKKQVESRDRQRVRTNRSQRKFLLRRFCSAHRLEIVVGLFVLTGIYICVILTKQFALTQKMEKRLRWIESNVSSIESDVDSIESDLSHIKRYGVQSDR